MRLLRLRLFDYRNFHRLDFSPGPGASVLVGTNAQGKTNLLESAYLLATMKELRVETEAQIIRWQVVEDAIPVARVVGEAETAGGGLKLEVAVVGRQGSNGLVASKTVKVNGVPKRLSDAVGRLTAVMFTAADIDLITGIREGLARKDELAFWDAELARDGGYLFAVRAVALSELALLAAEAHASLAPTEELRLEYRPRLEGRAPDSLSDAAAAAEAYEQGLRRGISRDVAAGMTLQGPHRDDIAFFLGDMPASGFASRAQQRTIALALRLAEARLLHSRRSEPPLLLLDDILSEMDAGRARSVIEAVSGYDQLLITATDVDRFPRQFLDRADVFSVDAGAIAPLSAQAAASRGTAES
jgi:DNA replication and repair protein RecF